MSELGYLSDEYYLSKEPYQIAFFRLTHITNNSWNQEQHCMLTLHKGSTSEYMSSRHKHFVYVAVFCRGPERPRVKADFPLTLTALCQKLSRGKALTQGLRQKLLSEEDMFMAMKTLG